MPFKVVFLAHASDAEPERDRSLIETSTYKLFSVVVRDQVQAVDECKRLVKDEGIHSECCSARDSRTGTLQR